VEVQWVVLVDFDFDFDLYTKVVRGYDERSVTRNEAGARINERVAPGCIVPVGGATVKL
jgi:hypothetical protein